MADARIPSLAPWGLATVPGYTLLPNGQEDHAWRERYVTWHRELRAWRVDSQDHCLTDEVYRAYIDDHCRRDTAFFLAHWLEVEEPRAMPYHQDAAAAAFDLAHVEILADLAAIADIDTSADYQTIHPFLPFAYQVQAVQLADYVVFGPLRSQVFNVLWDKARGVGLTFAMLAWLYKHWLYRKGFRATILTEKWDKADRTKNLNTLFGKLDLFFASTPDWIIPPGFTARGEKGSDRLMGLLYNPATGATIATEPTTMSSTRSGREAAVLIDEGAFQEYLDELFATAMGTTLHVLAWSSPSWQMGMQWQNKVDQARKDSTGTVKLVELDSWENPYQDKDWETRKRAQFVAAGIPEQFEVEYLRNAGAGSGTLV